MPSVLIRVPDFRWSGFYYPELREDVVRYLRQNVPELTDEDPAEPFMQLVSAFCLLAHLNNVLLDMVASERFLPTARLRSSVAAHLALIGVELNQPTPARTDLVMKLSRVFNVDTTVIPTGAKFATQARGGVPSVIFESQADKATGPTNAIDHLLSWDESSDAWTVHDVGAAPWTPGWSASPAAGDCLYIGHEDVLWDAIRFTFGTVGQYITIGVWEYYDGDYDDDEPDSVATEGGGLRYVLDGWLGVARRDGLTVRVKCDLTGAYEDVVVTWTSSHNTATTASTLGQGASPSMDAGDYTVGSLWNEVPDVTDGTTNLTADGDVEFTLPQTAVMDWVPAEIGPTGTTATAYWIRFRVVTVGAAVNPVINAIEIHYGSQYVLSEIVQGESQVDLPLGSSDGTAGQSYTFSSYPVVDDDTLRIYVTEEGEENEWVQVDDFLNSGVTDRHFVVTYDDDGRATVTFGDGANGKIPASDADNIRSTYRTLDTSGNGNVGANMVIVNRSGIAYADTLYNPRPAVGYAPAEGSTETDLERVKLAGPATLRTMGRGVTAEDVERLSMEFEDSGGARPIARAFAIEEGNGPKTIRLITVGVGGMVLDADQLADLEEYFNGSDDVAGCLLMNHELGASNYVPLPIDITVTVTGGDQSEIETALQAILTPVALKTDGLTYEWEPGGTVTRARIIAEIMNTSPPPSNVALSVPASDVALDDEELPTLGTISVTVV